MGAGVVGVTTAYALARAGHQVLMLDQAASAASVCSYANAGIIAVGHAESWAGPSAPGQMLRAFLGMAPGVKITRFMDPELWQWGVAFLGQCRASAHRRNSDAMAQLSRAGRSALQEIEADTGLAFDQSHDGVTYLYTSAAQYEARLTHNVGGNSGFAAYDAASLMQMDPALRAFGDRLKGGLVSTVDSKGDCHTFTTALLEWLVRRGAVTCHFGTTVTGFDRAGETVSAVRTDRGRFECDHVVIAAGTATPALLRSFGVRPLIYPVKGYSATYPILDASRIPNRPFIDETSLLAVTRLGDRLRVTATAEFAGYNKAVPPDRVASLDRYVATHFAGAVDVAQANHWAGLRPTTPSGRPYLGRMRRVPNLWLNAGHGQLGWTMAAGAGATLAEMLAGRPNMAAAVTQAARWLDTP